MNSRVVDQVITKSLNYLTNSVFLPHDINDLDIRHNANCRSWV